MMYMLLSLMTRAGDTGLNINDNLEVMICV